MLIAFYEAMVFYALIITIVLFLLWSFVKLRVRHFKRSNLILERKIADRTTEMQSMLLELTLSREAQIGRAHV